MKNQIMCGIDFGTSNSAIAIIKDGKPEVVGSKLINKTMPSLIYFADRNEYSVGSVAIQHYLEKKGKGRLVQSIKTFLSDSSFIQTNVYGKFYILEDFVAIILQELKTKAEKYVGMEIKNVVLGRPVKFSDNLNDDELAIKRLIRAAESVGFKKIGIQIEPIAAALDYEASLAVDQLVMVGDFGGGTSDFTIMKLSPKRARIFDRNSDILGTAGVNIAGDIFDSRIMWKKLTQYFGKGAQYESSSDRGRMLDVPVHILRTLCEWHKIPFLNTRQYRNYISHVKFNSTDREAIQRLEDTIEHNLGFNIFRAIDEGKSQLSLSERSLIQVANDYFEIMESITQDELEKIIKDELQKIKDCYIQMLKETGVRKGDIQAIFLTGGTSNLPHIKQMFIDDFGSPKIHQQGRGFTSVVQGLALSAQNVEFI